MAYSVIVVPFTGAAKLKNMLTMDRREFLSQFFAVVNRNVRPIHEDNIVAESPDSLPQLFISTLAGASNDRKCIANASHVVLHSLIL